ncbi:MarR family winged helix-turn-helix transcriptional regulator [Ottowia thiooxydans]|uniref:MarR family winged helix-turn-helix transcriptional regulator n=1 Tax=Ottowia thiooxydans TaxID=219182 RepID=UPI000428AA0A|nr:MarR family transcriptional regulator [Ottowia thiooxydans]
MKETTPKTNSAAAKVSTRAPSKAAKARSANSPRIAESDNWDQRLGFLMHDVSRLRRTVFDDFVKPLGVTRSQWWVLANLSRHDGMIQSDLANILELGKAALGGLIDRLEASGLVERRADEIDRRAKRVYLSSMGTHLISEMRVKSHELSERMLKGLDLPSRRLLADMLAQVKHNLSTIRTEIGNTDSEED